MCGSKEAWRHFVFVPERPPRRISRTVRHGAFFEVCSALVLEQRRSVGPSHAVSRIGASCDAAPDASLAAGRRRRPLWEVDEDELRFPPALRRSAVAASGAIGTAAVAVALASASGPLGPAAALLKVCMVAPPPVLLPPVPVAQEGRQSTPQTTLSPQPRPESFLDMIFPSFHMDTFVWRISCLQLANYLASLMLGSFRGTPKLCSLYLLGASWGPSIASGAIWRLFLPMMLHANALHIFFNILFQLRIGFGMEKQFGRRKFCLMYLFCGFLGNLLSVVANPFKLAVGASTSGFGLLGVWAAEVLLTWELLGSSRSRLLMWFLFMLGSCVMMSTLSPSVDFVGHFGGALAGFLLAIILADMREDLRPSWYGKAKSTAKSTTAFLVLCCLIKAITFGPDGPMPYCGSLFSPRVLPF
mmetsp:Transcript_7470/g.21248  ORF Transcript_7470/g.21248 Transcript_7470/m.21248 type:complete len:415 (-) Transcript_7470:59-1303(-)